MADGKEGGNEIVVDPSTCRPFKVCNKMRTRKVGVVASSFNELKHKCQEKFNIEDDVSFVTDTDGTEVDSDYLEIVQSETLMILQGDENWEAAISCGASNQNSDEKVMKLVEELRQSKKRKRDGNESKKGKTISSARLISVQVGWLNYSFKDERYKLVKATRDRPDSGPRLMKLNTNSSFESIERTLRAHYFPARKSPIGHEKKYNFSVGTFNGDELEKSLTLGEYTATHPKPRVYLLSKQTALAIMTDSSSDSDFELPKITLKKQHTSATATVTESMAMDLNDGFNVSTLPFDMTAAFQVDDTQDAAHGSSSQMDIVTPSQFANTSASFTRSQMSPIHQSHGTPTGLMDPTMPSASLPMPLTATFSSVETANSTDAPDTPHSMAISPPATTLVTAGTPVVEMKCDRKCIVCYDRPPTAFYFPCGHTSCLACALHIESNGGKCPHCRGSIRKVCSIFNDFAD